MDQPKDGEAAIARTLRVLARIAGSVAGLLAGGTVLFYVVLGALALFTGPWEEECAIAGPIFIGALAFLVGAAPGAAVGAIITQRLIKQRSSFWMALLGASIGTLVPIIGTVIGAVLGSGWKAKPAKVTDSSG